MRIVNLVTQRERGGAQAVALRLADYFRVKGHSSQTWFFYDKTPEAPAEPHSTSLWPARPATSIQVSKLLCRLVRVLRTERPDAVIGFTHYANVIGAVAAKLSGVPVFLATQHNPSSTYPSVARWADRVLGSTSLYSQNVHCSHAVAHSFDAYPDRYRRRSIVIPNGVRLSSSPLTRSEARQRLGIPPDAPLLVAVGRLSPQKNHAVLLQVLAQCPAVHLAIVGDGELRGDLEALARTLGVSDRLSLLGAVGSDQVSHVLRAATVFVMPSLFEGLSIALIEAMCEGLPILSSDTPGQAAALTCPDGTVAGKLLPPADVSAWQEAVLSVLNDHQLRQLMGVRARAQSRRFDPAEMAAAYLAQIDGLLRA